MSLKENGTCRALGKGWCPNKDGGQAKEMESATWHPAQLFRGEFRPPMCPAGMGMTQYAAKFYSKALATLETLQAELHPRALATRAWSRTAKRDAAGPTTHNICQMLWQTAFYWAAILLEPKRRYSNRQRMAWWGGR